MDFLIIFTISQLLLGNLGVILIHPPKLCAGLLSMALLLRDRANFEKPRGVYETPLDALAVFPNLRTSI